MSVAHLHLSHSGAAGARTQSQALAASSRAQGARGPVRKDGLRMGRVRARRVAQPLIQLSGGRANSVGGIE